MKKEDYNWQSGPIVKFSEVATRRFDILGRWMTTVEMRQEIASLHAMEVLTEAQEKRKAMLIKCLLTETKVPAPREKAEPITASDIFSMEE